MTVLKVLRFAPAALFLGFWIHLLHSGVTLKESIDAPINSNRFIMTIAQAMEDPWNQNSALRLFFRRLEADSTSREIWAGSQPYGWTLWHQIQADESLEIMLTIAHQAENHLEEKKWVNLYCALHPHSKRAQFFKTRMNSWQKGHEPRNLNIR